MRLHQATDPGAARLGEVALVDGIPSALPPDLRSATAEQRATVGVNPSAVHIDFMVGGPEVTVTGIRPDGTRIPILVNDTWQI